jgi:hypothetical protein
MRMVGKLVAFLFHMAGLPTGKTEPEAKIFFSFLRCQLAYNDSSELHGGWDAVASPPRHTLVAWALLALAPLGCLHALVVVHQLIQASLFVSAELFPN